MKKFLLFSTMMLLLLCADMKVYAVDKQDLFNTSNGDGVVPPYRIPGIVKTNSGRLIAVAGRLVCGTDPG